mgnify:CR=1 FL=1
MRRVISIEVLNTTKSALPSVGLHGVMIKLIRINETHYINADMIKEIYVSDESLTLYLKDGSDEEIKPHSGYYKTARKALGV